MSSLVSYIYYELDHTHKEFLKMAENKKKSFLLWILISDLNSILVLLTVLLSSSISLLPFLPPSPRVTQSISRLHK